MKYIFVLLISLITINSNAQVASRILATQSTPQDVTSPNFIFVDNSSGAMNRLYVANADSLKIREFQMKWWGASVISKTTPLFKSINWFPSWTDIVGRPTLATVSTTGNYDDLLGKPILFNGSYLSLTNIPLIFPTNASSVSGLSALLDNKITIGSNISYSTITGVPVLASVATSGLYSSLSGLPNLFSGSYTNLTNIPSSFPSTIATIPTLQSILDSKIAIGSPINYSVIIGAPSIPNAQIASDWNQTNINSLDYIKNKPIIPNVVTKVFNNNAIKTINGAGIQLSLTRDVMVSYTINHNISLTLLVLAGSSNVYLEISPNNSTWTVINSGGYADGVALAVVLNKTVTTNIQGIVPAGWYIRLRSSVTAGGSATYIGGQEVQL